MTKTIDLMDGIIKTKISLAIDEKTVSLLDDAVIGFRLIYLLSNNGGKLDSLTGEKNYSLFKSLLNRSEMVEKLIQAVRAEKIFVLGSNIYSLNDLKGFTLDLANNLDSDYVINATDSCDIDQGYLDSSYTNEFIADCKDKSIEETIQIHRRYIKKVSLVYKTEIYDAFLDNFKSRNILKRGIFPELVEYNQEIVERSDMENREESDYRNNVYANFRGDQQVADLLDILEKIFFNSSIAFTTETKCKIIRNKLFGESHNTEVSVLDSYYSMLCVRQGASKNAKLDETP